MLYYSKAPEPLSQRERILYYVLLLGALGGCVFATFYYVALFNESQANPATRTNVLPQTTLMPYVLLVRSNFIYLR